MWHSCQSGAKNCRVSCFFKNAGYINRDILYVEMKILFASKVSDKEQLLKKEQLFVKLRENYLDKKKSFQVLSYDNWFKKKLNNTHLLGVKRYNSEVQKFERFFEKNGRKWPKFFQAVRDLANLSKKDRERILESLK